MFKSVQEKQDEGLLFNEEILDAKKYIWKIVRPYFKLYSNNGKMIYDKFIKYCRDFDIFPEMCNKRAIDLTFKTLAENKIKIMYLDENTFLDAIILCGLKCKVFEKEGIPLKRIINFLNEISNSKGNMMVKKSIGNTYKGSDYSNPMYELKRKYEKYF